MSRLIVIDEDINKRRATELRNRGRIAVHVVAEFGRGLKDPELIQRLVERDRDCVLITADDSMPADHGPLLKQMGLTVAIVGLGRPPEQPQDPWEAELIHRWAHRIELQAKGVVLRYSPRGSTVWKPRKRPRTAIALESA